MVDFRRMKNSRGALVAGAAVLVALGAAGGAGAVQATRPPVEMAPAVPTPIAKLAGTSGIVTVKGRVAEVFGDRFVVQDASGRAMIAADREARGKTDIGQTVMVQGRYDDGQLRASYLVDQSGGIIAIGPHGRGLGGPAGPGRPAHDGPPPPPPPPPQPGCASMANGPAAPGTLPPPAASVAPANAAGVQTTPPNAVSTVGQAARPAPITAGN